MSAILALNTPKRFRSAVLDILRSAKKGDSVILNYFVIRSDEAGLSLLLEAYGAAVRGARVTLIVDDYGSMHPGDHGVEYDSVALSKEVLKTIEDNGVDVFIYHQIESTSFYHPNNLLNFQRYSRRNHNKNCIFNLNSLGKRGLIVGDCQWTDEHFGPNFRGHNVYIECDSTFLHAKLYTDQLLLSPSIQRPQYANLDKEKLCLYRHLFNGHSKGHASHWFHWTWYGGMELIQPDEIRFVASDIEYDDPEMRQTIQQFEIDLLQKAQRRVVYATPYFCPDRQMQKAFSKLQKTKGLDFKILMAKYQHSPFLPYGIKRAAQALLRHGINIYEFNGKGNFHYKDMIVDDYTFIKTANGEGRSRFYNLETGVIIKSKRFAEASIKYINWDLKKSKKLDIKYKFLKEKRPLVRFIKDLLCPLYYHHL